MASKLLDWGRMVGQSLSRETEMHTAQASWMLSKLNANHLPSTFIGKASGSDKGIEPYFPWET